MRTLDLYSLLIFLAFSTQLLFHAKRGITVGMRNERFREWWWHTAMAGFFMNMIPLVVLKKAFEVDVPIGIPAVTYLAGTIMLGLIVTFFSARFGRQLEERIARRFSKGTWQESK